MNSVMKIHILKDTCSTLLICLAYNKCGWIQERYYARQNVSQFYNMTPLIRSIRLSRHRL